MTDLPRREIRIEPNPERVSVHFNGEQVASSDRALALHEGTYPAVQYIPREDVNMRLLTRTAHTTHCPYKGDAAYYSLQVGSQVEPNVVWTYESPLEQVASIEGYLAFYPDRTEIRVG